VGLAQAQGLSLQHTAPAAPVPLQRSTSSASLGSRLADAQDPDMGDRVVDGVEASLTTAVGMIRSGGVPVTVTDPEQHSVSALFVLRHLASMYTHATQLGVPNLRGSKVPWEVDDLLGLKEGTVDAAVETGDKLQELLTTVATVLGVPYDPAAAGETLADCYFKLPAVQLMMAEAARGQPQLQGGGTLARLARFLKYCQEQPQTPHFSMLLALAHAPPTLRGLWVACQFCNMQFIDPVVNAAHGAMWEGSLLMALLEAAPGVWWAHCRDRLRAFLPLIPMTAEQRAATEAELGRLRAEAMQGPAGQQAAAAGEGQEEAAAAEEGQEGGCRVAPSAPGRVDSSRSMQWDAVRQAARGTRHRSEMSLVTRHIDTCQVSSGCLGGVAWSVAWQCVLGGGGGAGARGAPHGLASCCAAAGPASAACCMACGVI
jgi:hypothetical protein